MNFNTKHILFICFLLSVFSLTYVAAVTDAELEALEKQIEQQEAEEKKQAKAEAEAKRKAEEKRQAEKEQKRKTEEEKKRISELAGEMVDIPAGSFRMGDISGGDVSQLIPVHTVNISSFRMGKHEVTFDQWDACVKDNGCDGYNPHDGGYGRGKQPVINVSWDHIQTYIAWLNWKTGGGYRLPTEAEWEYAARAGTETTYHWGNDIGRNHANCTECGSQWDGKKTAPVGSFPANTFGLYDMHGNVAEWTQDCWHESYHGAPSDGSAWIGGECSRRPVRGGAWEWAPELMRSANRNWNKPTDWYVLLGFRLAQDK